MERLTSFPHAALGMFRSRRRGALWLFHAYVSLALGLRHARWRVLAAVRFARRLLRSGAASQREQLLSITSVSQRPEHIAFALVSRLFSHHWRWAALENLQAKMRSCFWFAINSKLEFFPVTFRLQKYRRW